MEPQISPQNQQSNPLAPSASTSTPLATSAPLAPQQMSPTTPIAAPINAPVAQASAPNKSLLKDKLPEWLFFYGFASIFLINFVNAIVDPQSFRVLLTSNVFVPSFLPSAKLLVDVAAVNDLAVGIFILTKWKKKWIYAWAGAWLLIVAITKAGHFLA